jgi:hypothetical protein
MTQAQREEIAGMLRGDLPRNREVEELINDDLDKIEPYIDWLVEQAELRATFGCWLARGAVLHSPPSTRKTYEQEASSGSPERPQEDR